MRLLLQRVSRAEVTVDGICVGAIGQGLLVLAGFGRADTLELPGSRVWASMVTKLFDLRIFPDHADKLNLSLRETGGGLLLASQFTLYADTRRGRRPSFTDAAPPDTARALYERLTADLSVALSSAGPGSFAQGVFGASMLLDVVNWGPVTILLDSADFEG